MSMRLRADATTAADPDDRITPDTTLAARLRSPRTMVSFLVAAVLVGLIFSRLNIDVAAVARAASHASWPLLLAGFLAYYAAFPLRAARWRALLVSAEVQEREEDLPSVAPLTLIVLQSWFVNCVVPAKLGDACRGLLLRRRSGAPFARVLGTVVAERLLDVVALAVLLIASGLLAFHGSVPATLRWWFVAGAGLALCGGIGLAALMLFGDAFDRVAPARMRVHVARLRVGVVGSFKRAQLPAVGVYTLGIWALEGARLYCVAHAFGVPLGVAQSTLVALLASLLTTFPVTPAGLGAVEGGMIVALKLLNVDAATAGAIALADRGIAYWSVIVIGGVAWLAQQRRGRRTGRLTSRPATVALASAPPD